MRVSFVGLSCLLLIGACAPVMDEKRVTAQVTSGYFKGESYEIATRTLEGPNGPYTQDRVVYKGRSAACRASSPMDCERAALQLIDPRFGISSF